MRPAFLVIDKPAGITSHDVVAAVRSVTGVKKVGHTGTLDPFAVGVLPLALGGATKLIQYLDESIKVYEATIAFGARTDTGDPTGTVVQTAELPPASADIAGVLAGFVGERMQRPPMYSAVKVQGKALYKYAREGQTVEVKPRPITVYDMELVSYSSKTAEIVISCSRGTYARGLAEEISEALGTVGHLSALRRSRSGPFLDEHVLSFPELARIVAQEEGHPWQRVLLARNRSEERVPWRRREDVLAALWSHMLTPIKALSHLPLQDVKPHEAARIRSGGHPPPPPTGLRTGRYLVVEGADLVCLAETDGVRIRAVKTFPPT